METLEQYDARENLDLFLSSSKSFQEQGTEEINGVETVRYDGVLSNDVIDEVLTSYGTLDQLGMSAEDVQSMIFSLGDVPVSCWIDKANYMVVQYQIDMTSMMQQLMSGMLESEGAEAGELAVDAMTILLTISNTNNVEVIELPAEVENAVELPQ